jgi:hypothetical protein
MPVPAAPDPASSRDDGGIIRSAVFSPDRRYRYHLSRVWPFGRGTLCFIMLNPSHADEADDDATIRKCMGFAKRFGYAGIDDLVRLADHGVDAEWLAAVPADLLADLDIDELVSLADHGGEPNDLVAYLDRQGDGDLDEDA